MVASGSAERKVWPTICAAGPEPKTSTRDPARDLVAQWPITTRRKIKAAITSIAEVRIASILPKPTGSRLRI